MSYETLVGQPAPTFGPLMDQNGQPVDLADIIGKQALCIFFYPAALTKGCTQEACSLRDTASKPTFTSADNTPIMRIIGVSSDTVAKQQEFAHKHNLPYTLLADTEQVARRAYKCSDKALLFIPQRVTYIIDKTGIVRETEDSAIRMGAHTKLVEKWAEIFAKENVPQ
eukprot:TRINITY_DN2893_c0_g1_i2.p1 TRINITY_DN2893_c0_g1~~TRINITY_DN2893_c0_g1_i2.p1  ORF type:complete len:189 (+),score=14.48 TRINITY_DN2893_c0_g1_i2:64-567(+)